MAWSSAASQYELENNRNQEIFDSDTEHEKKEKKNNNWAQMQYFLLMVDRNMHFAWFLEQFLVPGLR